MFLQNFIELHSTVHELSYEQEKKTRTKTILADFMICVCFLVVLCICLCVLCLLSLSLLFYLIYGLVPEINYWWWWWTARTVKLRAKRAALQKTAWRTWHSVRRWESSDERRYTSHRCGPTDCLDHPRGAADCTGTATNDVVPPGRRRCANCTSDVRSAHRTPARLSACRTRNNIVQTSFSYLCGSMA